MKSMGIVSLESVIPMNLVNSPNQNGSAQEFQKCMDSTKETSVSEPVAKTTKTSVVSEGKEVEQADTERAIYETPNETTVQEDVVAEELVDEVEQKMKDFIQSVLDVEESELETIMDELGLTYLELLEPINLQKLVMAVNDVTDVTDFLTNEKMLAQFTELNQCFEEINWKELTGMDRQEFLKFLEDAVSSEKTGEMVGMFSEEVSEQVLENVSSDETKAFVGRATVEMKENQDISRVQNPEMEVNDDISHSSTGTQQPEGESAVSDVKINSNSTDDFSSGQEMFQSEGGFQNEIMHQSVQESDGQPVTVMNFVENLTQATNVENVATTNHMQQMIDIVHQVVERIQTSIQGDTTTMEMQLNPENLGKVMLTVSEKGGVMTANFTVQTDEAREALESQLQVLRENLEQKNLKVESVEVSVSDFDFNQSKQMGSGEQKDLSQGDGKRRNFRFDEEEQDSVSAEEEAQRVRRSVMRDSGSSVDYTA